MNQGYKQLIVENDTHAVYVKSTWDTKIIKTDNKRDPEKRIRIERPKYALYRKDVKANLYSSFNYDEVMNKFTKTNKGGSN